jgi:hypothetical protein
VEQAQQEYQKQLLGIAEEIHPFSLEENTRTTAESVVAGLETRAQALETLAAQQGIQDTRSALKSSVPRSAPYRVTSAFGGFG